MSHEFDDESYTGCECEQCIRVNAKYEAKKLKESIDASKDSELLKFLLRLTNISKTKLEEAFSRKGIWDRNDEDTYGDGLAEAYRVIHEMTASKSEPLHERMRTCRFCGQFPCATHSAEALAEDIAAYTRPCRIHGDQKVYACNECFKGRMGEGENDRGCCHGFKHWGLCPVCNVSGLAVLRGNSGKL